MRRDGAILATKEQSMHITCTTPHAAAQVLSILLTAGLKIVSDFQISPVLSITPPIIFTMLCVLTAAQIGAIPDTTIT
jgi:hypothetical protein